MKHWDIYQPLPYMDIYGAFLKSHEKYGILWDFWQTGKFSVGFWLGFNQQNDDTSGKRLQFANWKMAIDIVDLPIKNMEVFHSYVSVYQRIPLNR